jgi:AcrR family transcriptional regulator
MSAVAERAGVTRRALYMHFATRGELVAAMYDYVADVEGLAESLEQVWSAPDAISALDEWAAHLARYHPRLLAVDRAVQRIGTEDREAAVHRARVVAGKLSSCRRLVRRLREENRLASGWTVETATDMLYALISSDVVEALLVDRRWSRRRLSQHLTLLFRSTFVSGPQKLPAAAGTTAGGPS